MARILSYIIAAIVIAAMAFWVAMYGQSLAQSQTKFVCWAQSPDQCPATWSAPSVTEFLACGTAGHTGFNPEWVCYHICEAPAGSRCRITPGPGGSGGQCGYRAARVDC